MSSGQGDAKLFARGKVAELRQELSGGGKKDKNHAAKKNAEEDCRQYDYEQQ